MRKVNYRVDEKNYITSFRFIPFRETEPYIETDLPIIIGISRVINGQLDNSQPQSDYESKKQALKQQKEYNQEMQSIKQWLSDNDYKVNKYLLGEYSDTDQRWLDYKAERTIKLARYNELEALQNDIG